jgi:hypothetical protein
MNIVREHGASGDNCPGLEDVGNDQGNRLQGQSYAPPKLIKRHYTTLAGGIPRKTATPSHPMAGVKPGYYG